MSNRWLEGQTEAMRHWLLGSRCPMIVSDASGAFLWVNEATENLFGYISPEFLGIGSRAGLSWHELTVSSSDLAADMAMVEEMVKEGRKEYSLEKSYLAKDGRTLPCRIHVLRWPPEGRCECFLVTVIPLDAQNEMVREEMVAIRQTLTEVMTELAKPKDTKFWIALVHLAKWANENKMAAGLVLLFATCLIFGERALEIWDRIKPVP